MKGFFSDKNENEETIGAGQEVLPQTQATTTPEELATLTRFQAQLEAAKVSGDFTPAFTTFVNTKFLIRVAPRSGPEDTSDFKFAVRNVARNGEEQSMVLVAETPELLASPGDTGVGAIEMVGGKLIQTLGPDFGILIALQDGGFALSKEQCQWLRESTRPGEQ